MDKKEAIMKKSRKMILAAVMAAMMMTGCASEKAQEAPAASSQETAAENTAQSGSENEKKETAENEKAAEESYTIGIGQFAEHGSLDNCREGFLKGLAEEGIVEGQNLTVLYENAQTDGGTSSQIMANFLAKDVDMICAIATPIAQSAYSAARDTDVPVIYTAVTDPQPRRCS